MTYDPQQENLNAERLYTERLAVLQAEEQALRDEYRREESGAANAELKQRLGQWVAGEASDARRKLGVAANGPNMEADLRELVPAIVLLLFPKDVENVLADQVINDRSKVAARLAEISQRIQAKAAEIVVLFEAYRRRTAPR